MTKSWFDIKAHLAALMYRSADLLNRDYITLGELKSLQSATQNNLTTLNNLVKAKEEGKW